MKLWANQKGKDDEFTSRRAFPFSEEVITSSGLKQFRVIHRWHDSDETRNIIYQETL